MMTPNVGKGVAPCRTVVFATANDRAFSDASRPEFTLVDDQGNEQSPKYGSETYADANSRLSADRKTSLLGLQWVFQRVHLACHNDTDRCPLA